MLIGYARVSTADQKLALQEDALRSAGCERLFSDIASGSLAERPGLQSALAFARRGDVLVVWKLDRLGRSLRHLIETVQDLQDRQLGLRSIQENLDTTSSTGKLVFHLFGALAEFERSLIQERTQAGLEAARARGRKGGRPRRVDEGRAHILADLLSKPKISVREICKALTISRSTFYRESIRLRPISSDARPARG